MARLSFIVLAVALFFVAALASFDYTSIVRVQYNLKSAGLNYDCNGVYDGTNCVSPSAAWVANCTDAFDSVVAENTNNAKTVHVAYYGLNSDCDEAKFVSGLPYNKTAASIKTKPNALNVDKVNSDACAEGACSANCTEIPCEEECYSTANSCIFGKCYVNKTTGVGDCSESSASTLATSFLAVVMVVATVAVAFF